MFARLRHRLPAAVFVSMAIAGCAGAAVVLTAAGRTEQLRFAAVAEEASGRIGERLRLHLLLIDATAAMIEAQGDALTAAQFEAYCGQLQLAARHPGIAGLGYAPLVSPAELPALLARLAANYGRAIAISPQPEGRWAAPVAILQSSDAEPPRAIGLDMYAEPRRRAAMEAAIAQREPRATEPLRLATDTAPKPGFIVYAPIFADSFGVRERSGGAGAPTGFAFGAFRIHELADAALNVPPFLPVALTISDADEPEVALSISGAPPDDGPWRPAAETRSLAVAGQTWTLDFRATPAFEHDVRRWFAPAFAAICIAFGTAAALALRAQARAQSAAEALVAAGERNIADQDLLLQEMKHRIKNVIARILAIARQTSAQSATLPEFNASFTQRLQAMAEAQDMLTRSVTATADLGELLERELVQVFGSDFDPKAVRGEAVELDAARTQALGLVFHELATNALKYGGAEGAGPAIDVSWRVDGAAPPVLNLEWRERGGGGGGGAPERAGFGTKLIDASIRHELGGVVERDWRPEGLVLRLRVPLAFG